MSYGRGANVVDGVDLEIHEGEFFTLLGPSGCGKTSTLRCIAGLETPTSGRITIGDVPVYSSDPPLFTPPHKRDIAMVFQSYAVWPHMTVAQNVAFPLEASRTQRSVVKQRVDDALQMVGLEGLADRPAPMLSGGQQQRVAFARAIVKGAKLLLLDEPLSNLDAKLRTQMRDELRGLQQRLGVTTIFVTHDQSEAMSMSDRIAVMRAGVVAAVGAPLDLYLNPPNISTARFVGHSDLIPGTLIGHDGAVALVETALGLLRCGSSGTTTNGPVFVLARPEHIRVLPAGSAVASSQTNLIEGRVVTSTFSGRYCEYTIEAAGLLIRAEAPDVKLLAVGEPVVIDLPVDRAVVLAEASGAGDASDTPPLNPSVRSSIGRPAR